jgi:hypothetical protein
MPLLLDPTADPTLTTMHVTCNHVSCAAARCPLLCCRPSSSLLWFSPPSYVLQPCTVWGGGTQLKMGPHTRVCYLLFYRLTAHCIVLPLDYTMHWFTERSTPLEACQLGSTPALVL